MTLVAVRGVYYPEPIAVNTFSSMAITATTHRAGALMQVPVTGTLSEIGVRTVTVTAAEPLRVRVETVAGTGDPSGTLLATDSEGAIASPAANTWYDVALTTPVAVTRGQRIAIVVDAPTGTPNLNIARLTTAVAQGYPFTDLFTTSWLKTASAPVVALKINGSWASTPATWPVSNVASLSYGTSSTPDERGNRFLVPFACTVEGLWVGISNSAAPYDVVLYDMADNVLASQSFPANADQGGTTLPRMMMLDQEVTFAAGDEGRITFKPTTTTVQILRSITVPTLAHWPAVNGRDTFYRTTRTDAGAWTDDTTSREDIGFILSALGSDSGGGPTGRYKVKVGGTFVDVA